MFNNSGQKIKGWAKSLFVILLIIGLFMIIVYHNQFKVLMENDALNITPAAYRFSEIIVFGFGFVIYVALTYISCLLIYGYGELIENTKTINNDMADQKVSVNQIKGDIRAIYLRLGNNRSSDESQRTADNDNTEND